MVHTHPPIPLSSLAMKDNIIDGCRQLHESILLRQHVICYYALPGSFANINMLVFKLVLCTPNKRVITDGPLPGKTGLQTEAVWYTDWCRARSTH